MEPYKQSFKPIRYFDNYYIEKWFGKPCKEVGALCKDVQSIWLSKNPLLARILWCALMILIFLLPLLYFLIPPFMTIASIYLLKCEKVPTFAELPFLPAVQMQMMVRDFKELFSRGTSYAADLMLVFRMFPKFMYLITCHMSGLIWNAAFV